MGFRLSGEILSIIVLRYMRKDGTLRFGDFVAIILNLTVAFCKSHPPHSSLLPPTPPPALYDRKDLNKNGVVKINISEWVRCALSC